MGMKLTLDVFANLVCSLYCFRCLGVAMLVMLHGGKPAFCRVPKSLPFATYFTKRQTST